MKNYFLPCKSNSTNFYISYSRALYLVELRSEKKIIKGILNEIFFKEKEMLNENIQRSKLQFAYIRIMILKLS